MCCEQLICARCAGRVAEARCPTCRAARAALHQHEAGRSAYAVPILLVLTALLYLILAVYLRTG